MTECNFYSPEEVKPLYDEIVPAYQSAFAGEPWFEVSKCADKLQRCVGGLCTLAVGQTCDTCGDCPVRPAYEQDELVNRFERIGASRPTMWYVEKYAGRVSMAALAWRATPAQIAEEKYADIPEMQTWLEDQYLGVGSKALRYFGLKYKQPEIMWLDEVFANKDVKPNGNLKNFGYFIWTLAKRLECAAVGYRTIEPKMTAAARRFEYNPGTKIFQRDMEVPDRRDFVKIQALSNTDGPDYGTPTLMIRI